MKIKLFIATCIAVLSTNCFSDDEFLYFSNRCITPSIPVGPPLVYILLDTPITNGNRITSKIITSSYNQNFNIHAKALSQLCVDSDNNPINPCPLTIYMNSYPGMPNSDFVGRLFVNISYDNKNGYSAKIEDYYLNINSSYRIGVSDNRKITKIYTTYQTSICNIWQCN